MTGTPKKNQRETETNQSGKTERAGKQKSKKWPFLSLNFSCVPQRSQQRDRECMKVIQLVERQPRFDSILLTDRLFGAGTLIG